MNPDIEALRKAMMAAQPSGRGKYIEDGTHLLKLDKGFVKRTQIGAKWKESYIFEFVVEGSTNATHEAGSKRSYVENPENDGWDSRIKACILALMGLDPDKKLTPAENESYGDIVAALRYDEFRIAKGLPENFLGGRYAICEGTAGKSRSGGPVTHKKWAPYRKAEGT